MSEALEYDEVLDGVVERDSRYSRESYFFVQRALHYYRTHHGGDGTGGHIRGEQLLRGVRDLAMADFGLMARSVLNTWGLHRGEDVGEIVYNLIEAGLMTKTEDDEKEDFAGVMAFDEAMEADSSW